MFIDFCSLVERLFFKPVSPKPQPATVAKPEPSGLLKIGEDFYLNPEAYEESGERDVILASSGMGKSYLTGVLAEEVLETGGMLCIVDPEGEYHTLKERYPIVHVGSEKIPLAADASLEQRMDDIFGEMLDRGASAIFDLSDFPNPKARQIFCAMSESLFRADERQKIKLIVDEAQVFAPQKGGIQSNGGSLAAAEDIAKRGRKRGLDSLWATQRPASLNKEILSQCNRFWFGGIQTEQDYNAIKSHLNEAGISFDDVRALEKGEFFCSSNGQAIRIKVRKRYCTHGGGTPKTIRKTRTASRQDVEALEDQLSIC